MTIRALASYRFGERDQAAHFPAPLLYVGWEGHLMFCAPFCLCLPGNTLFSELCLKVLPGVFGEHPDFARIDWDRAQWFKSGTFWIPKGRLSLQDNGLRHKDVIRFRTPGLGGIQGSGS